MGRIRKALDALFDRSAKNAPQPGSVQTSFQLAQVLGLNLNGGMNAERPDIQIKEGFNKNVVVFRCVQEIARSAATVDMILYRRKQDGDIEEVKSHPLIDLMDRPNIQMGGSEFLENWVAYFVLTGNTYLHAITVDRGRKLKELWPLRADRCEPDTTNGVLTAYKVSTDQGQRRFPVDPITGLCEIVHTKSWNPSDPFKGQSPLMAAALSVDIHNASSDWTRALLENSAQPSGALVMAAAQGGVPNKLTDDEFDRLKQEIETAHSGAKSAGKPLLLEGGLQWQAMGLSPKDMDFLNARNTTAREIALAFGVPPMLLGIPGDNTYSNQKEARLWFWEDTVLPTLSQVLSSLNRFISVSFPGQNLFFGYDEDKIPALSPRREDMWDRVTKSEILRVDEKREALGYEALGGDGGDAVLVSGSLKRLDDVVNPPEPVAEPAAPGAETPPAANDDNPAPAAVAAATRSIVAELKRATAHVPEVKLGRSNRAVELEARGRLLTAAENALRVKVKRHLRDVGSQVASALKAGDYANVDNVVEKTADDLEDILIASGYAIGEVVSDRFFLAFKGRAAPERKDLLGTFWGLMAPFVEQHAAEQVVGITNTTREQIKAAISEGQKLGLGMNEIADLVSNAMRTASPGRSLTIAQTEAHASSSFAAEASARSVGVPMDREWGAAGGERTRPSHAKADGQVVGMDQPFTVGGSSLMYPGDPTAPAKETVNCRCAVLYHPRDL